MNRLIQEKIERARVGRMTLTNYVAKLIKYGKGEFIPLDFLINIVHDRYKFRQQSKKAITRIRVLGAVNILRLNKYVAVDAKNQVCRWRQ